MTISPDMRQNAREAKAYDQASTTATAVAAIAGGIAVVAWAFYIAQAGGAEQSTPTVTTATFVVALVATAFSAAFGAAWLVLDALHRAHTAE
jgi:Flp pilus assembly protein CpaB